MNETKPEAAKSKARKRAAAPRAEAGRHGFYTSTFTPAEKRRLNDGTRNIAEEKNLLRVKILRLARLTPLKKIEAKELEALIKLMRVVAVLDALERTGITARKLDGSGNPLLDALADMDPDDL